MHLAFTYETHFLEINQILVNVMCHSKVNLKHWTKENCNQSSINIDRNLDTHFIDNYFNP